MSQIDWKKSTRRSPEEFDQLIINLKEGKLNVEIILHFNYLSWIT